MASIYPTRRMRSSGFSLVEIMVGLVIGMIGVTVMMQVFAVAEGYKRNTTGSGDVQTNGAIALNLLQRDVRQAGYGSSSSMLIACDVQLRTGVTLTSMAPVTVNHSAIPAGDSNTDTLLVVYGSSYGAPEGDSIVSQSAQATYSVSAPSSFSVGDMVIPRAQSRPSPCSLSMEPVLSVVSPSPPNVTVATGVAGMSNGRLFNLGPAPQVLVFAIRNGNLTQCDFIANDCANAANVANSDIWVPIANGIVAMRAQYARDATGSGNLLFDQSTPTACMDWLGVVALRVALVGRSDQYDKKEVTASAPTWSGSSTLPISFGTGTEWKHYRYKVFQSIVPLRNILATGATACT